MNYEIIVSPAAQAELDEAYLWLLNETALHAPQWYNGALDAMQSLENNPTRCHLVSQKEVPEEIRQLLYGDKHHAYKILFTIRDNTVFILHILHAPRNRF